MRRVVFVDLDDTLFQTQRKDPTAQHVAAVDRAGQPLSFQSPRQRHFLEWLGRDAVVVPVTGRNVDAYRRVLLPFSGPAACSFGGVILTADGAPHPVWHDRMASQSAACAETLIALESEVSGLAKALGVDARWRVISDAGLPLYLSVKHNRDDGPPLTVLAREVAVPAGWTLHLNDANMALLPPFLRKEAAVAFLKETLFEGEAVLSVGVGDSLTDGGFMAQCDYALTPSASQLGQWLLGAYSDHVGSPSSRHCGAGARREADLPDRADLVGRRSRSEVRP